MTKQYRPKLKGPKSLDKKFWGQFSDKNRDFGEIFGGFQKSLNYLEMNKII